MVLESGYSLAGFSASLQARYQLAGLSSVGWIGEGASSKLTQVVYRLLCLAALGFMEAYFFKISMERAGQLARWSLT